MKLAIHLLLIILTTSIAVVLIQYDPGQVTIQYGNTIIETSLWVACIVIIIALVIGYLLWRAIHSILNFFSFADTKKRVAHQQKQKIYSNCLGAVIRQDWEEAYDFLKKLDKSDNDTVNLAIAYIAYRARQYELAHTYLSHIKQPDLSVDLLKVDIHLANMKPQAAATVIDTHIRSNKPSIIKRLLELYKATNNWSELLRILHIYPTRNKQKILETYLEAIQGCKRTLNKNISVKFLEKLWDRLPDYCQSDPRIANALVDTLLALDKFIYAQRIIEYFIETYGDDDGLISKYHLIEIPAISRLFDTAHLWLNNFPHSAAVMLCLGNLSKKLKLWNEAKVHAENSFMVKPHIESLRLYVEMLQETGNVQESHEFLYHGIKMLK